MCPACKEKIRCGPGGWKNIKSTHLGKKTCSDAQHKRNQNRGMKNQSILSMFSQKQPKPIKVPSTTAAPAPLPGASREPNIATFVASRESSVELSDLAATVNPAVSKQECTTLVDALKQLAKRLHDDVCQRAADVMKPDPLACFDVDPAGYDNRTVSADELWEEVLNGIMKNALGWGTALDVPSLVETDGRGVIGLARFVEYFVVERGVSEALFEGKLNHLMSGLRSM